jgi:hypothetical protein
MLTPKQPVINAVLITYIDYSITENYIGKMASFLPYTRPEPLLKVLHHISIWMVMSISKIVNFGLQRTRESYIRDLSILLRFHFGAVFRKWGSLVPTFFFKKKGLQ